MEIHDQMSFIIGETIWRENVLIPANSDKKAKEFIESYQAENLDRVALEQGGDDLRVTIALCALKGESWFDVAKDFVFKKDGWCGGSLALWKLYMQKRKEIFSDAVLLPGTLYLDDDLSQWVPLVRHRPIISLLGGLRGSETKVSMKPSTILGLVPEVTLANTKIYTVLIYKIETVKT